MRRLVKSLFGTLCRWVQDYKPQFVFWKLVLLTRKLLFAVVIVLLKSNVLAQVSVAVQSCRVSCRCWLCCGVNPTHSAQLVCVCVCVCVTGQASCTVTVILVSYILQQRLCPFVTVTAVVDNLDDSTPAASGSATEAAALVRSVGVSESLGGG